MKRPLLVILLLLLVGGGGALLVGGLGHLAVENRLSNLLGMPVRIERLDFSANQLNLTGVTFGPTSGTSQEVSSPLAIDHLQLKGSLLALLVRGPRALSVDHATDQSLAVTGITLSLAGVPLRAEGRVFLTPQREASPQWNGWLAFQHNWLRGRVELSGSLRRPVLLGWIDRPQKRRKHFVGALALSANKIELRRMKMTGDWHMTGQLLGETRQGAFELSGPEAQFKLDLKALDSGGQAELLMKREGLMPETLSLVWKAQGSGLDFQADFLQEAVHVSGQMDLTAPYPVVLDLKINPTNIMNLTDWVLPGTQVGVLSGIVSGQVTLSGPLAKLNSQGKLTAKKLVFGLANYPKADVRFEGLGPILQIANTQLTRPGGVLLAEGHVDLRRIGKPDFFSAIKLSSVEKNLEMAGWEMGPAKRLFSPVGSFGPGSSRSGASGLELRQASAESPIAVGLSYGVDEEIGPEPLTREGMEVDYALGEEEFLNLQIDKEETFLGIERRGKF